VENLVAAICQKEGIQPTKIQPLHGGQVNHVYRIDEAYVLRIGARERAFQRLKRESELIQSLSGEIPIPKIYAFGELNDRVYQIQQFIPGQKLYTVWNGLAPTEQENIAAELAAYLKILHSRTAPHFGDLHHETGLQNSWPDYLSNHFQHTLDEIEAAHIRMAPGFVELAAAHFEAHQHVLRESVPVLVHGDLSFGNILVDHGKISALLDFEYAMQAPKDYELWVIEAFCLYPNDYAEVENEYFCTGDFGTFLPLLRKHDPDLFAIPHLRQRVDLYHLEATLSSYVAWRKYNLSTIPADKMAAKEFYMARITNFITRHGVRLF
jgi:aminoglycoside phosphotransferase (APT) family kinase protein